MGGSLWSESISLLVCLSILLSLCLHSLYLSRYVLSFVCFFWIVPRRGIILDKMGIILGWMVHEVLMMDLALLNWA